MHNRGLIWASAVQEKYSVCQSEQCCSCSAISASVRRPLHLQSHTPELHIWSRSSDTLRGVMDLSPDQLKTWIRCCGTDREPKPSDLAQRTLMKDYCLLSQHTETSRDASEKEAEVKQEVLKVLIFRPVHACTLGLFSPNKPHMDPTQPKPALPSLLYCYSLLRYTQLCFM